MYREFGPVYGMSILGDDEIVVCDPVIFGSILRQEGKFPIGAAEGVSTFTDYYKENNLTVAMRGASNGPEWWEWRDSLNADMFAAWDTYMPAIAETCRKISDVAGDEVPKNIAFVDFISRAAFDMFETVMYGSSSLTTNSKVASSEDIEFVKAAQSAFDITGALLSNPMEKVFEGDLYKKFVVNMDKTFSFARKRTKKYADLALMEQQSQEPQSSQQSKQFFFADEVSEDATVDGESSKCPVQKIKNAIPTKFVNPSFIERLVHRGQLNNEDISEIGAPLLMAGVDTTAYVMSWLYLNLASNPDVQTKLAKELQSVLKGADLTTVEQIESLPYLRACIRESHRLTPVAPIQPKKMRKDVDIVLPNGDIYRVEAGKRISLNLRAFPMDPQFVENPTKYQPERFLPDAVEARKGTPSEIIDHPNFEDPFGRGKRRCLGGSVAKAEIMILAARLIQDWEISLVDPMDATRWTAKQKLMLKADPYPAMKLVRRDVGGDDWS
ncbi:hypothetical protein ACHAXS_004367 [Conticribra weissflogii]